MPVDLILTTSLSRFLDASGDRTLRTSDCCSAYLTTAHTAFSWCLVAFFIPLDKRAETTNAVAPKMHPSAAKTRHAVLCLDWSGESGM
jgi:hypothetical protein